MQILRWTVRIHKWIALLVGVQVLLWIAGGLVMSAIPIEIVRGEHKIAAAPPTAVDPHDLIPLETAARSAGAAQISGAALDQVLGKPVWRIETDAGTYTVDARSGEALSPVTEALAREIAIADYSGTGQIARIEMLAAPPAEYGGPGPVWQVVFSDAGETTLYIDPASAAVRARRSSTWRFYDFFWRLHVMDYDDGADFNHPLLVTAAGAGLFVALSGLVLLVFRLRRTFAQARARQPIPR